MKKKKLQKLKNKTFNRIIWLSECMPASRRTLARQTMAIIAVLDAHKEFQMINRQDIMILAKQQVQQQDTPEKQQTKPINKKDVMYG